MTAFFVITKFDGRSITVRVMAKNAEAAMNKAARIWPCRRIVSCYS